ncbi:MAG: hypothetical protein IJF52_04200 [Clostridia bacterium]|nr:hypothetical protein [Clostridia bacterium]
MKIELLFPELSTVYGDAGNALYLKKTCKDAQFIETHLQDKPHFVSGNVDMIYIGSMTEKSQIFAINALKPYVSRIKELIENGVVFLCTGNSMELFGEYIAEDDKKVEALGVFPFNSKRSSEYFRHNSMFLGDFEDIEVVGCRSQFAYIYSKCDTPFMKVKGGIGNNPDDKFEGIHYKNFFATYVLGPLLPLNPKFTKHILSLAGFSGEVAFEKEAMDAYNLRLEKLKEEGVNFILGEHW